MVTCPTLPRSPYTSGPHSGRVCVCVCVCDREKTCHYLLSANNALANKQLFHCRCSGQKVGHKCAPAPNITTSFVAEFHDAWDNGTRVHYGKCGIDVTSNVSGEVVRKNLGCFNGMLYDKPRDFSIITEVSQSIQISQVPPPSPFSRHAYFVLYIFFYPLEVTQNRCV